MTKDMVGVVVFTKEETSTRVATRTTRWRVEASTGFIAQLHL